MVDSSFPVFGLLGASFGPFITDSLGFEGFGERSMLCRGSSTEKSSLRLTAECDVDRTGVALGCRAGDGRGPSDDLGPSDLRGEELRVVFIGDRALGGGSLRRAARTAVGSGIVPVLHSAQVVIRVSCKSKSHFRQYPCSPLPQL